MDEHEYVTDVLPEAPAPAPPPLRDVALRGAWLGALAGFAFLGWETATTGWLGLQPAAGLYPFGVGLLYLGTGALIGTLVGALRLGEGAWAAFAASLGAAWLLCGHLGLLAGAGGSPVALIGLVFLAILVGYFGAAQNLEDSQAGGFGVALFLSLAVLLPVDLHHLLSVTSLAGLLWNLGVVVVAVVAGGLVGLVLADGAIGLVVVLGVGAAVGWLAAAPVLWPQSRAWPVADVSVGPPMVVIAASGLRADRIGAYGAPRPTTPSIDALAGRAVVYGDAATHAPWTLPAVASLFTSRLPSHHDVGLDAKGRRRALGDAAPWLPERLARRGYVTAAITTDPELTARWGTDRGFDAYDGRIATAVLPAALHPWRSLTFDRLWPSHRRAGDLTDRAVSFVAAQPSGSWFLFVQYGDLAVDGAASVDDLAAIGAGPDDALAVYDARVHGLDTEIGRLLAALPPETVVVLTAAHGIEVGERRGGQGLPAGARFEHSVYQEVLHVPLIVAAPGVTPVRTDRTVPLLDVAPTLAALAGADASGMNGVALAEVAPSEGPVLDRPQVAEHPRVGPDAKSVRDGRYKVIAWKDGTDRLFDLHVDPVERSPILQRDAGMTATVRELRALMPPFE